MSNEGIDGAVDAFAAVMNCVVANTRAIRIWMETHLSPDPPPPQAAAASILSVLQGQTIGGKRTVTIEEFDGAISLAIVETATGAVQEFRGESLGHCILALSEANIAKNEKAGR